jgi:steroid delta-isomerase-like uncharacterized protein
MSEQNKRVERRLIEEVWNNGNFAVVDELVASDYIGYGPTSEDEVRGPQEYKAFYRALREGFPDLQVTVEDQIAEADRVVTRWTARGTHQGEFEGFPPTGNRGAVTGITIDRVAGGKVVECWTSADEVGLMRLVGALPQPA